MTLSRVHSVNGHLVFIVPIWGDQYLDTFLERCLPSLLAEGNVPSLGAGSGSVFRFATSYKDWRRLERESIVEELRRYVTVEFVLVDGLLGGELYQAMSACYSMGMENAPEGSYFLFLTADSYWSDGTIRALLGRVASGYKAVMVMPLRVCSDAFWSEARSNAGRTGNPGMSGPELAKLALAHLHPMAEAHNVFSDRFVNNWPSHLYWRESGGLSGYGFHLHPLLVKAPDKGRVPQFSGTIDTDFLEALGYPVSSFYIVTDCREIQGVDLCEESRSWSSPLGPPSVGAIIAWAKRYADKYNWYFFSHRITIGADGFVLNEVADRHRTHFHAAVMRARRRSLMLRPIAQTVRRVGRKIRRAIAVIRLIRSKVFAR